MKRVYCLYRVSSVGQVDHDDIPMQKIACREYAQEKGWTIIKEVYEKGVSGYKISSEDRDAIQELKDAAEKKRFDVLLVFMFDRLGRRDDETPFVVEWFVKHGVEVWSVKEGEQRFENHVDKLTNYIRYWQASGESEKTAIRIRTRHVQLIQEGHYRGGRIPFGYRLEYLGRVNKKNQPVRDMVIDETKAEIVRQMFNLMVQYGYGTDRITQWLNEKKVPTRKNDGSAWKSSSVRGIMRNSTYTGKLHLGKEIICKPYDQYRIISDELFERAQDMMNARGRDHDTAANAGVPYRTAGRSLLTGIVFCAKCGHHLYFTSSFTMWKGIRRYWANYRCETRVHKKDGCMGQWVYSARRLETYVTSEAKKTLALILKANADKMTKIIKANVSQTTAEAVTQAAEKLAAARANLLDLENRMLVCVASGQNENLDELNKQLPDLRTAIENAKNEYSDLTIKNDTQASLLEKRTRELQSLRAWAVNFDILSHEEKKLVLAKMIHKVVVNDGYEITIQYHGLTELLLSKIDKQKK